MAAPPTSKIVRSAIGGAALAHVGLARIGHQARKLTRSSAEETAAQQAYEAEVGRLLFDALNRLKGTALKVSQLLSTHADFLPAGIRDGLAKGCHQVTPLNRAMVYKLFRSEFGKTPEQLFDTFEAEAFAAASLGQVHRATLADGRKVAVKVQYPGIGASIKSDLAMLSGIIKTLGGSLLRLPPKELVARMMADMESKLDEELDYEHESAQLAWFHHHVPDERYVVPQPLPGHSSRRVLTMDMLDGLHLDAWLATGPDQTSRNHFGQLLFDWFMYSVHELGRVNADPHAGNFLFMPDGRLGLLDFGCTRSIDPAFPALLQGAWNAMLNRPQGGPQISARLAYIELQLIRPTLSQDDFDTKIMPVVAPMVDWQLAPFRALRFDFATWPAMPVASVGKTGTMAELMTGMHPDLPYFDRAFMGTMQLLKKIGAVVATDNRWIKTKGE
jgi:predicted unusual protein kinase regulating ubiquinone biosynthesis (AarF/ABC1/UbiB family)